MTAQRLTTGLSLALLAACSTADDTVAETDPVQFGTCPNMATELFDMQLKKQLEGSNGTFVDECDENGDLIEYSCRTRYSDDGYGGIVGTSTDEVMPNILPCGGTCVDGRCRSRCPAADATLIYVEVGSESIVIQDTATGLSYGCVAITPCDLPLEVGAVVDDWSGWGVYALCLPAVPGSLRIASTCSFYCGLR